MRRSRSREQALAILMGELDRLIQVATPTKSLVLAVDGPPGAAKLATQRRRRYSTYVRISWKLEHFEKLRLSKKERQKRKRSFKRELDSIEITPGTDFMKSMESALVYWAWQRLMLRDSKLKGVDIYISSSAVHGEGEIKLMDWVWEHGPFSPNSNVYSKRKPKDRHESICFLGDDSDLLLEGMVIPPNFAHNVFVVRQQRQNHFCISLWETTRTLAERLPSSSLKSPIEKTRQIFQARTDFVLLMMMNGNDYLPRLRGARGFSRLLSMYMKVLAQHPTSGLIEANSLELQLDFCIDFFQEVADSIPLNDRNFGNDDDEDDDEDDDDDDDAQRSRKTPLGEVNTMMDSGFLPKPAEFSVLQEITTNGHTSIENGADEGDSTLVLVRMTLGDVDSDSFLEYEVWHDPNEPYKVAKQQLAAMALDAFLGTDYAGGTDSFDAEGGITNSGYAWEIAQAIEGNVDTYLGGLVWNLQTYQDGICVDYGYNYGRRMSPTAQEIVDFLSAAKKEGRCVGKLQLFGDDDKTFRGPISAGLSCLAALPSEINSIVPRPYRDLPHDEVESFYEQCMDPTDNVFDLKKFEYLCEERLSSMDQIPENDKQDSAMDNPKYTEDTQSWVVLSKSKYSQKRSFKPPQPPTKRFGQLFENKSIKISHVAASPRPRTRASWGHKLATISHPYGKLAADGDEDIEQLLQQSESIFALGYKDGFQSRKKRDEQALEKPKKRAPSASLVDRMKSYEVESIPNEMPKNKIGQSPIEILKALADIGMIGDLKLDMTRPSPTDFAAFDPEAFELTTLSIQSSDESNSVLKESFALSLDREINTYPRKIVKHQLGSMALNRLTGSKLDWSKSSIKDVKLHLMNESGLRNIAKGSNVEDWTDPITTKDGSTAVECLKQLRDIEMIGKTRFLTRKSPPNSEIMQLIVKRAQNKSKGILKKDLSYEHTRDFQTQTKRIVKQRLASMALADIAGSKIKWNDLTYPELRDLLMEKSQATKFSPPTSK
ncbi:unnamed protein product [Cylindrotheca closterium]|uniref:Xrn1 N-terminal domain-containing protein n=1 Tax=Cylindrotheca closterium TaxID=2856 RepID=A0AAD2CL47_9STRA|nr:unnamed protein product [Cylindrotheca closterium]